MKYNGYKRKLLDDVSLQELHRMRDEEGMSNAEIAAKLETSRQTITKYLGPEPKNVRKHPAQKKSPPDTIQPKNTLILELQVTNYAGEMAKYKLTNMQTVDIAAAQTHFTKDELQTYIVELMEIYSQM